MQPPTFVSFLVGILSVTSYGLAFNLENSHSPAAVNDWIKQNANNLPSNYDTFSQHSPTYRRAIFQKLDDESRGSLWAKHLDSYISKHPDLTPEKLAVIEDAKEYVTSPEKGEDRAQKLEDSIKSTFDDNEARDLVMNLGNNDLLAEGNDEKRDLVHLKRQGQHSLCECSLGSYWACCGNADCGAPPMMPPCIQPVDEKGCGAFWQYKCTGLCPKGTWDEC